MSKSAENIISYHLTGKPSFEETTVKELEQITTSLPYFGIAQLLLAKKMKHVKSDGLHKQVQKTALHFPNPLWLNYHLIKDEWNIEDEDKFLVKDAETPLSSLETEMIIAEENSEEFLLPEVAEIVETPSENIFIGEENRTTDEEDMPPGENAEAEMNFQPSNQKMSGILEEQLAEFKKPVEENAEIKIETDSYYTIDYFASQGIKLQLTEDAKDELTVKMRKFTDWLRQMKRVNPHPTDLGTDEATEHLIQDIAETSNEAREIITEAMAEVLAKQGKLDKAIQVYIKLSFLNPSRSAYFVAKIRELKGI